MSLQHQQGGSGKQDGRPASPAYRVEGTLGGGDVCVIVGARLFPGDGVDVGEANVG